MEIARGAEARITREGETVVKDRIVKGYRLKEIDERLRKRRTRIEASLIRAARRAGVHVPSILEESDFSLKMQYIEGKKIKDVLEKESLEDLSAKIGQSIARLHIYDIVHGDLTTSNMILHKGTVFFIDFGLGFQSKRIEDKAVDLSVLHEALESTHSELKEDAWKIVLAAYRKEFQEAEKVIKTLHEIEKRGRYRERTG